MSLNNLFAALFLVGLVYSVASADDYSQIEKLTAERQKNETVAAAQRRWQSAQAKLEAMPEEFHGDYRHCFLRAVALFRLKGPDAAMEVRNGCTSSLIRGTRHDGIIGEPEVRARAINDLNTLVDGWYKAALARVRADLARARNGSSSVRIVVNKLRELEKSGRLTSKDARKALDELERVKESLDPGGKLDPKDIDLGQIDWQKLTPEQIDLIPSPVKDKLRGSLIRPPRGGKPPVIKPGGAPGGSLRP